MPKEIQTDPRKSFVPRLLPWILGGAMLIVYWATLNHWVTLLNIGEVASASGWTWGPQVLNPLVLLVTLPFRALPVVAVPLAMNVFSSFCAAATLAVLARSVAILPHDRTELERARERCDLSFLTGWVAWIPPIAAVIFAGFQLGFWQNATSFTGESVQLLWFAVILWQLLEYRLDEQEERLLLAAVLYGAGMADNWALVAFFPLFLTMLVWLRGLSFFNLGFLLRMTLSGLSGLLVLLVVVVPLAAKFSGAYSVGVWDAIKYNLHANWQVIQFLRNPGVRNDLALISLTSLLPTLVMSLRWSSDFGDSSRIGTTFVNYVMHTVNVVLLGVLVWVTFDPPFSPARLLSDLGMHTTALTIYYLIAMCIGYFTGYFLLIFGKDPVRTRRNNRPDRALPKGLLWLSPVIVAGELSALALATGLLLYKNTPAVLRLTDDSVRKFGQFSTQQLPPEGAILLCDSDNPSQDLPLRAYAVQAQLAREGRSQKFPVIDTHALQFSPYHHFLHRRFPHLWPDLGGTNDFMMITPFGVITLLDQLARSNTLCYLNPSFGYYFEHFYQEPHGLFYTMKALPTNTLIPPPLSSNLMSENEAFWQQVLAGSARALRNGANPPDLARQGGVMGWFMEHLHVLPDVNPNAVAVAEYYSKGLNTLGVQVQRAGNLNLAATLFTEAQELNSNNVVAAVNLAFNKSLRNGSASTVDLSRVTADQFGKYRGWVEVMGANGPFDETSFCFGLGCWLVQNGLSRQAVASFDRVRQLAPDNLAARLFLAQIYVLNRMPALAAQALHDPLTNPSRFALTDMNSTEVSELAAAVDFQNGKVADGVARLEKEMDRHPEDETLLLTSARTYNILGLRTNALNTINRKLRHTPDDPTWLFGKGLVSLQAGAYDEAVATFDKVLELQTNYPIAVFDRALANYQLGRLDAARRDFLRLQAVYTNNFRLAYDLGEIAWRQNQTNEMLRNYHIYLANAPTNAAEQRIVRERMTKLDAK